MTDYASAAPVQPIAQGRVFFPLGPGAGNPVSFDGKGILSIARGANAQGDFVLTLDPGLRGNAGAVPPGPPPPPDPDVRSLVTAVGGGLSGISAIVVAYQTSAVPGVGATEVHVVTANAGFGPIDPALGLQIVIWRGQGLQAGVL